MLNFKTIVNELPNTNWNDPQVILMILATIATCIFTFLLWRTSERNADIADAALEISKKAQQVNKEQHDLLEKLKRQEVFESISEIQKVLFDFASCNFNTFRSRWISELYTIDKPSSLDLSQSFNSGEVDIINNIFGLKDKFIRENLLESNGELKSGFNGTELENVIQKSNELFKIMTDERNKLKPRN